MDEESERRRAENEVTFRAANEKIRDARLELMAGDGPTPFLCECADPSCREVMLVDLAEYEFTRAEPARFLLAAGHAGENAHVVRRGDGYEIVVKEGVEREVAEATDPRGG